MGTCCSTLCSPGWAEKAAGLLAKSGSLGPAVSMTKLWSPAIPGRSESSRPEAPSRPLRLSTCSPTLGFFFRGGFFFLGLAWLFPPAPCFPPGPNWLAEISLWSRLTSRGLVSVTSLFTGKPPGCPTAPAIGICPGNCGLKCPWKWPLPTCMC